MTIICPCCETSFSPGGVPGGHCPRCLLDGKATGLPGATLPCPTVEEVAASFPGYEILSFLGRGGMGAVFKALHVELDRLVAIKVLLVDTLEDPSFEDRFRREARMLARLDHPNIVRLYDFGRSSTGLCFLVMELVDGHNVQELISKKEMSIAQTLGFIVQLCDALQYAHGQGLVHRDVKPSNVLVDKENRVRIADFGLAKMLGDGSAEDVLQTQSGISLGTPLYMAPEQRRANGVVDHRADIYSLGVMLYEMLTGEIPQGVFRPVSSKVDMDRRIDDVVTRALKESPSDRYQAASEVKTDVRKLKGPRLVQTTGRKVFVMILAVAVVWFGWYRKQPLAPTSAPLAGRVPAVSAEEFTREMQADYLARLAAANPGCRPLTPETQGYYFPAVTKVDTRWRLDLSDSHITNLEPLRGSPFTIIMLYGTSVRDLSPLKESPVENILFTPPEGFDFTQLAAFRLRELLISSRSFQNIREVLNPDLEHLTVSGSSVSDLSGLAVSCPNLRNLNIANTKVTDISPLKGMRCHGLILQNLAISSVEPLRGMPVQNLNIQGVNVADLSPLLDNPALIRVECSVGGFGRDELRAYLEKK